MNSSEPAPGTLAGNGHFPSRRRLTPADMIELSDRHDADWSPAELAAILRHQLHAPLEIDLDALVPQVLERLRMSGTPREDMRQTFADLLLSRAPSIELLQAVRQMVKRIETNQSGVGVPREVGWAIYLASVLAARVRLGQRIGNTSDDVLRNWIEWALEQPWLDASLRPLLMEGREGLARVRNVNDDDDDAISS